MEYTRFHPSSNSAAALIPELVIHHYEMIWYVSGAFTALDTSSKKRDVI